MPTGPADASMFWHRAVKSSKGGVFNDDLVRKKGAQIKMHKKLDRLIGLQRTRIARVHTDLKKLTDELQVYFQDCNPDSRKQRSLRNRLDEMERRLDKVAFHETYLIPAEMKPGQKKSGKRLHDLAGMALIVRGNRELLDLLDRKK